MNRVAATEPYYFARFTSKPDGELYGQKVTAEALVTTASGYTINLTGAALTTGQSASSKTLNLTAQLTTGKVGGTVTIAGDGSFTPLLDILQADNQTINYTFRGTSQALAFSYIDVRMKGGVVTSFTAGSSSGKIYNCYVEGNVFAAKCAGTISVSADKRTLTFNGFKAGLGLSPNATVAFEGSLTSAGL